MDIKAALIMAGQIIDFSDGQPNSRRKEKYVFDTVQ